MPISFLKSKVPQKLFLTLLVGTGLLSPLAVANPGDRQTHKGTDSPMPDSAAPTAPSPAPDAATPPPSGEATAVVGKFETLEALTDKVSQSLARLMVCPHAQGKSKKSAAWDDQLYYYAQVMQSFRDAYAQSADTKYSGGSAMISEKINDKIITAIKGLDPSVTITPNMTDTAKAWSVAGTKVMEDTQDKLNNRTVTVDQVLKSKLGTQLRSEDGAALKSTAQPPAKNAAKQSDDKVSANYKAWHDALKVSHDLFNINSANPNSKCRKDAAFWDKKTTQEGFKKTAEKGKALDDKYVNEKLTRAQDDAAFIAKSRDTAYASIADKDKALHEIDAVKRRVKSDPIYAEKFNEANTLKGGEQELKDTIKSHPSTEEALAPLRTPAYNSSETQKNILLMSGVSLRHEKQARPVTEAMAAFEASDLQESTPHAQNILKLINAEKGLTLDEKKSLSNYFIMQHSNLNLVMPSAVIPSPSPKVATPKAHQTCAPGDSKCEGN